MPRPVLHAALAALAALGAATLARAQPDKHAPPTDTASTPASGQPTESIEAKDLPDYTGDLLRRADLSGDWCGHRSTLARAGVKFDFTVTQIVQGVVGGGRREDWDYGINLDACLTLDLERLHLPIPGTFTARAESRFGETVNDDTGAIIPTNTRGYFPLTEPTNEAVPIALTELNYAVTLVETLTITVGKLIVVDGDPTEFAGGRGRTQFMNGHFIYNAVTSQTSPYAALGASLDWTPAPWITLSTALYETTDASTVSGFQHLDDGWTWWGQAAAQYTLGGLPGGVNAGFQYAFDNDFLHIGGTLSLVGGTLSASTVSDSWAVFFGAWQYLYAPAALEGDVEVDPWDDTADLQGLGLFARLGCADPDANPVSWSISVGLGARGLVPGRDDDTMGAGYVYTALDDSSLFGALGLPTTAQAVEVYYGIALTPAARLTVDAQWIDEQRSGLRPATVVGLRLDLTF